MKIIVDPKRLEKALAAVLPIAKQALARDDLSSLTQLHAEASGEVLLRSVSFDGQVTARLDCEVEAPGTIAFNGEELDTILGKLKADEIVLTAQKGALAIAAGRGRFRVSLYPAETAIDWQPMESESYVVALSAKAITALFDGVLHARRPDKSMADATSGIFLEPDGGVVRAVTTDGHRLALRAAGATGTIKGGRGVLLSLACVERALGAAKSAESVVLKIGARWFTAETSDVTYQMRLLGSAFPDFRRVIPPEAKVVAVVERKAFLEIVDRLMAIKPDLNRLSLRIHADSIHVQAEREANLASEDIDLEYSVAPEQYEPQKTSADINVNGKFLIDTLKSLDGALAEIHLHGPERPITIRPHRFIKDAADEQDALDLIMPLS